MFQSCHNKMCNLSIWQDCSCAILTPSFRQLMRPLHLTGVYGLNSGCALRMSLGPYSLSYWLVFSDWNPMPAFPGKKVVWLFLIGSPSWSDGAGIIKVICPQPVIFLYCQGLFHQTLGMGYSHRVPATHWTDPIDTGRRLMLSFCNPVSVMYNINWDCMLAYILMLTFKFNKYFLTETTSQMNLKPTCIFSVWVLCYWNPNYCDGIEQETQ